MKQRKGSLIIATCLLSVVLLIILMTMFNINRKNAELITVQSDREKAYQVARIGLNKATEEIEKAIDDYFENNHTHITWKELYELEGGNSVKDQEVLEGNKYFYSYSYSYKDGKITSTGSYGTSSKDNIKITLTANYIMDYMGIYSSGLYYIPKDIGNDKNSRANIVGLNAVYSQETQCPMTPWINLLSYEGGKLSIPLPKNRYLTNFNLSSTPISSYYLLYDNKFYISGDQYVKDVSKNKSIANKEYVGIREEASRCFIKDMIKALNVAEQCKYEGSGEGGKIPHVFIADRNIDKSNKNVVNDLPVGWLKKLYVLVNINDFYYSTIFEAVKDNLKEVNIDEKQIGDSIDTLPLLKEDNGNGTGIYKFNNKYIKEKLNISESPLPELDETSSTYTDSDNKNNKNIYLLNGRNIIIIPVNSTVVIDGDLILDKNENMLKDDVANYPVLLVTGNLVVNGSIKGIGTVFSMNSITINALAEPTHTVDIKNDIKYEKYKKYVENAERNGAVIVHACNQLYINNTSSLLSDKSNAESMTSSWILTQDRNAITRVDSDSQIDISSIANMFKNSDREPPQEFLENSLLEPIGTNIVLSMSDPFDGLPDDEEISKPSGEGSSSGNDGGGSSGNTEVGGTSSQHNSSQSGLTGPGWGGGTGAFD